MNSMQHRNFRQFINLTWRLALTEFKLRNEGSYLGILWYVLNPLLLFAVLLFVFSRFVGSGIEQYPAYLVMGILMFNFFSRTTLDAANIIKDSGQIKSFFFQREALVFGTVLKHLFAHVFEVAMFFILLAFFGIPLYNILLYFSILFFFVLFMFGVGLFLAALTVYFIDLANVWQFSMLLLWFGTPIFYSVAEQPALLALNHLNPLYYFITGARESIVYGQMPDVAIILGIVLFPVGALAVGYTIFSRLQPRFAELI